VYGPICRAEKDFTKIKGTLIDLSQLVDCIRSTAGVRSFQVVLENEDAAGQRSRDVVTVHVLPEPGVDQVDLEQRLRRCVKASLEFTPDRIVMEASEEQLHDRLFQRSPVKAEYIIDRRADRV
jgi:hypothetical protein